jgi:WD40 repeat protein
MKAQFAHSNPEFAFERVPDGEYTLVACCHCDAASRDRDDNKMPVTVSGADVSVSMVLPYPALPQHSPIGTLAEHTWSVSSLAFSPDGAELISASRDGSFIRWDLATGEGQALQHGHPHQDVILSRGGEILAIAMTAPSTIELWDTKMEKQLHTLQGSGDKMRPLAFSPNGLTLAVEEDILSGSVQITLWDVTTGERLRALDQGQHIELGTGLYFLQNDTTVSVIWDERQEEEHVVWWDVATGDRFRSLSLSDIKAAMYRYVRRMAISPDQTLLAFGMCGVEGLGGLAIWDTSTEPITIGYPNCTSDLAFSPDGTLVALTTYDNTVVLWDTSTGEARYVFTSGVSGLCEMVWSPDGKMLAAGAGNGTIVLWEAP